MSQNRKKVEQILDANFNRTTEGLRVVEELCRFVLEDSKSTLAIKLLRGRLSQVFKGLNISLAVRNSEADLGRTMYTKSEGERDSLTDIFLSNFKRAQEALRCLEEFSKLFSRTAGQRFKQIRFQLYTLEKSLLPQVSKAQKLDFDLYVLTGADQDPLATVKKAIADRVKIVQLRLKNCPPKKALLWARKIRKLTAKAGVTFIVNDDVGLARKAEADGVHLGQTDGDIARARKKLGAGFIIGASATSSSEAKRAVKDGADYIGVGPVFWTKNKPTTKAIGCVKLKQIVGQVNKPIVAIGGINCQNLARIIKTGCQRAAVIDAADQARIMQRQLEKHSQ